MKNAGNLLKNPKIKKLLQTIAAALLWFIIWIAACRFADMELLIPSPAAVLRAFCALLTDKSFYLSCLKSLLRVLAGWTAGLVCGTALAVLTNLFTALKIFFTPALHIIKATPVASFIILALVLISSSRVPVFTAFLIATPIVWTNISEGLNAPDKKLLEMAAAFKMTRSRKIRFIYIPALLPYLTAAATAAMGLAWKAAIAAEVICTPSGSIGAGLQNAKVYLETPSLFAWTVTVIFLSFLLEKAVKLILSSHGGKKND